MIILNYEINLGKNICYLGDFVYLLVDNSISKNHYRNKCFMKYFIGDKC